MLLVSHDRELLRALTTRVWVLHERHITDFDGNFGEWEVGFGRTTARGGSRRRPRTKRVRRVQEKKKTARREESGRDARDARGALRAAQKKVVDLEVEIQSLEARIDTLTTSWRIPRCTRGPMVSCAPKIWESNSSVCGRDLESALDQWTAASDSVDTLTAAGS